MEVSESSRLPFRGLHEKTFTVVFTTAWKVSHSALARNPKRYHSHQENGVASTIAMP